MRAEHLFVATVEDLRRRCELSVSEYDMVQVAGLLRRLLLDQQSLATKVNKEYALSLTCSWTTVMTGAQGVYVPRLWLDPLLWDVYMDMYVGRQQHNLFESSKPKQGSVVDFMKVEVLRQAPPPEQQHEPQPTATVKDLIRHFANLEGGVHWDPKLAKNSVIESLRGAADEPLRQTLLAVGRIVHRALDPLAVRVALSMPAIRHGIGGR